MSDEPPLIGRDAELAAGAAVVRRRPPHTLVIEGVAGCGKTRLALELAARAKSAAIVRTTQAVAAVPLGALAPLLPPDATVADAADAIEASGTKVIVVDDAHLLDPSSAAVVHALNHRVTLILTARTGELSPFPDGAEHIALGPLSREATAMLAAAILGAPLDGAGALAVWETTRGNPLFVRELLLGARDLVFERDLWRFTCRVTASARLVELLDARLSTLPPAERDALELLVLAGELGHAHLAALADPESVDVLLARGLVTDSVDRRRRTLRVAHPLYGDVVRESMGIVRRLSAARRLADGIETLGARRRGDVLAVGTLRLEGGGAIDPHRMLEAARRARALYDEPLTARLAAAARDAGAGVTASILEAEALVLIGEPQRAARLLADAFVDAATDRDRTFAANNLAKTLYWGLGQDREPLVTLEDARAQIDDPAWRAELDAELATYEAFAGQAAAALARSEPLLSGPTPRARVAGAVAAAQALTMTGRLRDAIAVADRGLEARLNIVDDELLADPGLLIVNRCHPLMDLGELAEARANTQFAYDGAIAVRSRQGQGWMAAASCRLELIAGDLAAARRWAAEATTCFADLDNRRMRRYCAGLRANLAGLGGDAASAATALAELDEVDDVTVPMLEHDVARGRAWAMWAVGDHVRARDLLRAAAGEATAAVGSTRPSPSSTTSPGWATRAPRPRRLRPNTGRSTVRSQPPGSPTSPPSPPVIPTRSAHAASALIAIGVMAEAADAAAAIAVVGGRGATRALDLAAACGGLHTPALDAIGPAGLLTPREREVAALASAGATNRQIAERLGISLRTAANHLARVHDKLGTSDRAEVAAALGVRR